MPQEIERKFLIKGEFRTEARNATRIFQGYLSSVPGRIVRIRIKGNKGFITIKGEADVSGVSRFEWEKEIPVKEAEELLNLCEPDIIIKIRYEIPCGKHIFEVDEFEGNNAGLLVAEVELASEDEIFVRPLWLGEEVTGDPRYYNSMLSKKPYKSW